MSSILLLALAVVIAAFTSKSKDGQLDVDNNELFRILEPALKLASWMLLLAIVGILIFVSYLTIMGS